MANAGANCFLQSEYKEKLLGPNPTTERGYTTVVNFHPKENKIIYPSNKYIVIRNLDDPSDTFVYRGHGFPTTVAKFSSNGFWVASADKSGKVRIWSYDNPQHLLKVEVAVFSGPVLDLDWGNENKHIVASGEGGQFYVKCFAWDTGNTVGEMVGHNKRTISCSYKPSRPFKIMTGSEDFGTIFYSGPPFKMSHTNNAHTNFVNSVRYSPDGCHIVSVGSDKKIQLYDGANGQTIKEKIDAHTGSIHSVYWKPDSKKFITASTDKTLKLWDVDTLSCEKTFTVSSDPQIGDFQVAICINSSYIVSISLNGNINIFKETDSTPFRTIEFHQTSITSLYVDIPNNIAYTGSSDGVVCSVNTLTGETKKICSIDRKNINGAIHTNKVVGFHKIDSDQLLTAGWDDKLCIVSNNILQSSESFQGQPAAVTSSTTVSDMYAVISNKEIVVFKRKEKIAVLSNFTYTANCCSLLGDTELAIGCEDSKTRIYSISKGALLEIKVVDSQSSVSALAYSPNEYFLAIGTSGRQVDIFERSNWSPKIQGKFCFHTSKVTCLSWSPDGNHLASGSVDSNIFIWNLSAHDTRIQFQFCHSGGVNGLGWLGPKSLISVGSDISTVIWKVPID